jgi:hypothetical protein
MIMGRGWDGRGGKGDGGVGERTKGDRRTEKRCVCVCVTARVREIVSE